MRDIAFLHNNPVLNANSTNKRINYSNKWSNQCRQWSECGKWRQKDIKTNKYLAIVV